MRKIPTIFLRAENEHDRQYVLDQINPECQWVFDGEGIATVKYDGACVMKDKDGRWWARREVKPGGNMPQGYIPVHYDATTGKTMGWEPIEHSPHRKIFATKNFGVALSEGEYELVGPKTNGNPHNFACDHLLVHGADRVFVSELTFHGIRETVLRCQRFHTWEGIVWHHPDGRKGKIKARDFRKEN